MSGKLHIKSDGNTELYLQDATTGRAANIYFENTDATRSMG